MALLTIEQSAKLCKKYGIETPIGYFVKTPKQAIQFAKKMRYPLALKVVSPQIIHKTEAGAVATRICGEKELERAFGQIVENAKKFDKKAKILGCYVQEMAKGTELIIGGKKDLQFGPTILFGVGGTMTEIYKDYSLRICPITMNDALEMIEEIKAEKMIEGFRNKEPIDKENIAKLLMKASNMLVSENIKELDLNPIMADKDKLVAVDIRIIK